MANYDGMTGSEVISTITGSANISPSIVAAIAGILGSAATAAAVTADNAATIATTTATAVFADPGVAIDARFGASSPVKAVVTAEGVNGNNIVMQTSDDVAVILNGGQNDSVATGSGNDEIQFSGGSATINAGTGNDVVSIMDPNNGSASIDGGDGFDRVSVTGGKSGHTFGFQGGRFFMHSADIQMDNINVITFNGASDIATGVTVLAENQGESLVARLYQVALGRNILDGAGQATSADQQLSGYQWWLDNGAEAGNDAAALLRITEDFLGTTEAQNKMGNLQGDDLVAYLCNNAGVSAQDQAGFAAAYSAGQIGLAEMVYQIATAQEGQLMGLDGQAYVVDAGFTFPA